MGFPFLLSVGACVLALLQQQLYADWNVVLSAGRYTVAAVPATVLLTLFALSAWIPTRAQRAAAGVAVALLLLFDLYTVSLVRRFYDEHPRQPAVQRVETTGAG